MALKGLKVIEMLGLAPGPFCGMVLADFGANVTVVHKIESLPFDVMSNGKRMVSIDLKSAAGTKIVKELSSSADILLDTFRPGVMEKLGLGPDVLMKDNPGLIYARLTGYGQTGPYSQKGGHDINYVSLSGVLSLLSLNKQPPFPPLNLLADFGGGGLSCVLGILLAIYERTKTGKGQVIDVSMVEGTAYLASWIFKSKKLPIWTGEPGTNILDGGAAFYKTYKTKDDKFMSVGALEPSFYKQFLEGLQLSLEDFPQYSDTEYCKKKFEEVFLTKTQEEWCNIFDKLDACVTPVLDFESISKHSCNEERKSFYENDECYIVPEPSPKLSVTPGVSVGKLPHPLPGQHTIEVLRELNYTDAEINDLISEGYIYTLKKSNL